MPITNYYVASDAMGSATAILDEEGNVLERRSYDAFGKMTCMTPDGTTIAISPTGVDVGFQGQTRDEATGLYQMGHRHYSPSLGRWLSSDPIGLSGGTNAYDFTGNAPTCRNDPSGLAWESTETQGLHYNQRDTNFAFALEVAEDGRLIPVPLSKSHTFNPDKAREILDKALKDEKTREMLRKKVAENYSKECYRDKVRLERIGRALRLAIALKSITAIASAASVDLTKAARAYVNAPDKRKRDIASADLVTQAVDAQLLHPALGLTALNELTEN
jgi:RHS repeat-associated protein